MKPYDRVAESTSTTGTGQLTLSGASFGYQSFSVVGDSKSCDYCIFDPTSNDWEIGIGTYTLSTTKLSRDIVIESSNSNNLVSLAAGVKQIFLSFNSKLFQNDFGTGADGSVTISTDTNWDTNTMVDDTGYILKNFTTLTINSGKTVSAAHRAQAMIVKVTGNCTINGTLTMNAKGAAATPSTLQARNYYLNNLWGEFTQAIYQIPAVGAQGGLGSKIGFNNDGLPGSNGINGQTGGGGGGAGGDGGTVARLGFGGDGAPGSCFCGGSGGGGGSNDGVPHNATDGALNGGAGGDAGGGSGITDSAASGAGNPPGTSNTQAGGVTITAPTGGGGGIIILLVGGNLTIGSSAIISADGSAGGSVSGGSARNSGGGGSGGGTILILYAGTLSNSGTITVNGGAGGVGSGSSLANNSGGAGGNGSIIGPKQVLP